LSCASLKKAGSRRNKGISVPHRIEKRGKQFAVLDEDGNEDSSYTSRPDAVARIEAIGREQGEQRKIERQRTETDPNVLERRRIKGAYKVVERDPVLKALKTILPRKGEIESTTQRSQQRMLNWLDGMMSAASSDPKVHAELNKSAAQRRTMAATLQHRRQGDALREQVTELWNALVDVPPRKRASTIARKLNVDVRHVRRLLKKADISSEC
jgi:hypothetical protein